MPRSIVVLAFAGLVLAFTPGCLFVRHNTRVVRQNEKPRPMQFQSEQARSLFEAGLVDAKSNKELSNAQVTAVPLLFWYSRLDVPSDNAVYNDQLLLCDANGDGMVADHEAAGYRQAVQAKAIAAEERRKQLGNNAIAESLPPGMPAPPGGLAAVKKAEKLER